MLPNRRSLTAPSAERLSRRDRFEYFGNDRVFSVSVEEPSRQIRSAEIVPQSLRSPIYIYMPVRGAAAAEIDESRKFPTVEYDVGQTEVAVYQRILFHIRSAVGNRRFQRFRAPASAASGKQYRVELSVFAKIPRLGFRIRDRLQPLDVLCRAGQPSVGTE